ncbi:MAG TPA: hypothetical protein VEW48_06530 [Thermoanaerobaculia bacterium]|nr:hypothetical protein [Thermoanaerobaculia bacterium]
MRISRLNSWLRGLFGGVPGKPSGDEIHSASVEFLSPLNRGVLGYLRKRSRKAGLVSASPTSVEDPLTKTSTHPEIGERLWGTLAASLPVDCRWIVCGTPVLMHPQTGVLFGVGIGMAYCLRLTDADMEIALKTGASTEIRWSSGSPLDLARQFGPGWVAGSWQQVELEWCRAEYEALGRTAAGEVAPEEGVS